MMTIGKGRVLVVDDEPSIRENLERLLQAEGYETVGASNGVEALERASQRQLEAALLDIKMPLLSGMEVLRGLTSEYPDIATIMVTGVVDVETAVEAMKLGAFDYILKPFNLDEVLLRLKNALERSRLLQLERDFQKQLQERLGQQEKELQRLTAQAVQSAIREAIMAQQFQPGGRGRSAPVGGVDLTELGSKILNRLNIR